MPGYRSVCAPVLPGRTCIIPNLRCPAPTDPSLVNTIYVLPFASRALALGEVLPIIGPPCGQRQAETTACYAHLYCDAVRKFADQVAVRIANYIL